MEDTDLLIIGGGINGAGIARDAAGRGASVILCEQADLASATSSGSSKLIHGGLRYLEYYEFRLVREALMERERLLAIAPHIIRPLRFVLPHDRSLRPAWMIRLGLGLYDHLAPRRRLPASHGVKMAGDVAGQPLNSGIRRGFAYSDCWVDDARLVVLNAQDAARRGARILTRTRCVSARRRGGLWHCQLLGADGSRREVTARALVNAAGPWVGRLFSDVLADAAGPQPEHRMRLVKGSHIVVPRLYDGEHAYILQNPDRRIVFVIPYEGRFTLIGTTDIPFDGDPAQVSIDQDEITYLCASVSRYFRKAVEPADVVWSYSAVRPLYDDQSDDAQAVTRDYVLDLDAPAGQSPLLSIFGGKITTYRRLAEHALEKLAPALPPLGQSWTAGQPLPGGDLPNGDRDGFIARFARRHPMLNEAVARRLAGTYGTAAEAVIGDARRLPDLGRHFGGGLYQREIDYLVAHEWARSAADILWRRSKLGLHLPASAAGAIDDYLAGTAAGRLKSA